MNYVCDMDSNTIRLAPCPRRSIIGDQAYCINNTSCGFCKEIEHQEQPKGYVRKPRWYEPYSK